MYADFAPATGTFWAFAAFTTAVTPTLLVSKTAATFLPYAPVSAIAISETAARIPAYSTATSYMVHPRGRFVNDSPDRPEERLDLLGRRGSGIRACTGPIGDLTGHDGELGVGDVEVAEPFEAAEPRKLLDAGRRVGHLQRGCQRGDGFGDDRRVETQGRREAQRVEAAVRRGVAPAQRLRHR